MVVKINHKDYTIIYLQVHIICYELVHNEYQPSFIDVYPKLCTLIEKSPFVTPVAHNAGLRCPVVPVRLSFSLSMSKTVHTMIMHITATLGTE